MLVKAKLSTKDRKMKPYIALIAASFALSGCVNTLSSEQQAQIGNMSSCDKIQGLLTSFNNEFAPLKKSRVKNKYMEVWQASYNLVGENCQISKSNNNAINYMCHQNFSEKDQAIAIYSQATSFTQSCLKNDKWKVKTDNNKNSVRTTYYLNEQSPSISIHSGKTLAKLNDVWMVSFEVGKR